MSLDDSLRSSISNASSPLSESHIDINENINVVHVPSESCSAQSPVSEVVSESEQSHS